MPDEQRLDEYIEDESPRSVLRDASLRSRLEIQQELAFQLHCEKEEKAILQVKKILENCININKDFLESLKTGNNVQNCIRYFYEDSAIKKLSTYHKESLFNKYKSTDLSVYIREELEVLGSILYKITENVPYISESLYLSVFQIDEGIISRTGHSALQKGFNQKLVYAPHIEKILEPFLSCEFRCFISELKKLPFFKKTYFAKDPILLGELLIKSFYNKVCDQGYATSQKISRLEEAHKVGLTDISAIFTEINSDMHEIRKDVEVVSEGFSSYLTDLVSAPQNKMAHLMLSPLWYPMRHVFGRIYQVQRELEELNSFLDNFVKIPKSKDRCSSLSEVNPSECLDVIPALDETFVEKPIVSPTVNTEEECALTQAFIAQKAQQLLLWKQCIEQRKTQRLESEPLKEKPLIEQKKEMGLEEAQALISIWRKMSKDSQALFKTFFYKHASFKAHTLRWSNVAKLFTQIGGRIEQVSGSHFAIVLPDFKGELKTVGGSYKPHGSDEWNQNAHKFCSEAFETAGITFERIEEAAVKLSSQASTSTKLNR